MYRVELEMKNGSQSHNFRTRETAGDYINKQFKKFFKKGNVVFVECGSEEDGIHSEAFVAGTDNDTLRIKVEVTGADTLETSFKQKVMCHTVPHLAGLADYQHCQWEGEEECNNFHKMFCY